MPGYTKYAYLKYLQDEEKRFNEIIKIISSILPREYDYDVVLSLIKTYYPFEWQRTCEKLKYYQIKDKHLARKNLKTRYHAPNPDKFLLALEQFKIINSNMYKATHALNYNENIKLQKEKELQKKRLPKIERTREKVNRALEKTQKVEPEYLDALIGLYDRKNTSQKDRVYIMHELMKYYCPKVLKFFQKKIDTEYNMQLRQMAFKYYQDLGYSPKLRKQKYMRIQSKNKKTRAKMKMYAKERFDIKAIPEELEYRINNSKEQQIKVYDFFISHSSKDFHFVQTVINKLNKDNKNVYCDWINDNDYLKRHLVGDATKFVIETRIEQSKAIMFVESNNSKNSNWVEYELNYARELGKPIYRIAISDLNSNNDLQYELNTDMWFLNELYKEIDLFKLS